MFNKITYLLNNIIAGSAALRKYALYWMPV